MKKNTSKVESFLLLNISRLHYNGAGKVESFLLLNISRLHYNGAVFYLNIIDHFYV